MHSSLTCLVFPLGEGRGEEGERNRESEREGVGRKRVRGRKGGGREGGKEFDNKHLL